MPSTPFGVNFRGLFASALGSKMPPATLKKRTQNAIDVNNPTAGGLAEVQYPCKAVGETYQTTSPGADGAGGQSVSGGVRQSEFRAIVFLGTLPANIVPTIGDVISMVTPFGAAAIDCTVILLEEIDPGSAVGIYRVRT